MSKKNKAFQISALLTAVSGATLLMSADSVRAAENRPMEERCWDEESSIASRENRFNSCGFIQYGLIPGSGNNNPLGDVDTPDTGGGGGGPTPVDSYTN